jgi:type II pantothenate kinase
MYLLSAEMLALSEAGDNAAVDMLVKDIYGQDYSKLGLKSTMIASSFGKVFKKGKEKRKFSPEDISKSLLYAVSNNIGQIAFVTLEVQNVIVDTDIAGRYMNAEKYGLNRIYFGGCFIRGHPATIATLSYAIRFWSKDTKRALFLRHEGFLYAPNHCNVLMYAHRPPAHSGAIGAWIKNIDGDRESDAGDT